MSHESYDLELCTFSENYEMSTISEEMRIEMMTNMENIVFTMRNIPQNNETLKEKYFGQHNLQSFWKFFIKKL